MNVVRYARKFLGMFDIPDVSYCRGRILRRNPDNSFLPRYSKSPLQLCLENEISISSKSRNLLLIYCALLYNVNDKGGKPDIKPLPLPDGLRNPCRNLKSENPHDYAQKPKRNCRFMNSASGNLFLHFTTVSFVQLVSLTGFSITSFYSVESC
jgi:hypothetical protein